MSDEAYLSEQEVATILSSQMEQDGDPDWDGLTRNYMLAKEYIKRYKVGHY
jgi:hypothetical protein